MESRFRDAASSMSPEAVLQQWFGTWPDGIEQIRLALEKIMKDRAGERQAERPRADARLATRLNDDLMWTFRAMRTRRVATIAAAAASTDSGVYVKIGELRLAK